MPGRAIGVALLGLGGVGTEVARVLVERAGHLEARLGAPVKLVGAAVRDASRARDAQLGTVLAALGGRLYGGGEGAAALCRDPAVDVVVELTGNADEGVRLMDLALGAGKDVVTASKVAIARAGTELLARAAAHGVELRFEAAVGGGIPLLGPLEEDLAANAVSGVRGIVNGTTNYILGRMAQAGLPFAEALGEAQRLGYAEPDPTADVEGGDAACKLAILARLAFGTGVAPEAVFREGISRLGPRDLAYARELGYVVKLLAIARRRAVEGAGGAPVLELRVHPVFLPVASPLAKVDGALNAVEVSGDLVGSVVFHGPGAGGKPTASSVLGDVLAVARRRLAGQPALPRFGHGGGDASVLPIGEIRSRYYLRLQVLDRPGVFAQVTLPLGDRGISLAQVIQRGAPPEGATAAGDAEIVLLTYEAREADMQAAVRTLATLPAVHEVSALVRVE